jgi:hypothetical protein
LGRVTVQPGSVPGVAALIHDSNGRHTRHICNEPNICAMAETICSALAASGQCLRSGHSPYIDLIMRMRSQLLCARNNLEVISPLELGFGP